MDNSNDMERSDGVSGTIPRVIGNGTIGVSGTNIRGIRNKGYPQTSDLLSQFALAHPSNSFNLEYLTYLTAEPFPITRCIRA